MSDYMFMLDSHLNSDQSKVVAAVRDAAAHAGLNLFLTGGAMRDMLGGFPIRDLDFTIEGSAVRFVKGVASDVKAEILHVDDLKKSVELKFPNGVLAEIAMARQEKYGKPGSKPQIQQATIHEDLRGRDFTINAIGLSLSKASFGLLLDPTNGHADIERKELHTVNNYSLYDDPSRLLRLIRLKHRLGYRISERTQSQYQNVREAKLESAIPAAALERELHQIALEEKAFEILEGLSNEGLLSLFGAGLTGTKLNAPSFQKLQKAKQLAPFGQGLVFNQFALFLNMLVERLSPKERTQLVAATGLDKKALDAALRIDADAKKLERSLMSAKLQKPSALYLALSKVPGELILFLLMKSNQRIVVDRLRNYLQKYLPAALEITDAVVEEHGATAGTPKFAKVRNELIAARLDSRPRKVAPVEVAPPPPAAPPPGRRHSTWGR